MSMFKKAERKNTYLKIGVAGASGSGKTYSSLELASGFCKEGEKIAVLDSENDSASLYADSFSFDTVNVQAPYTPEKYIQVIQTAIKEGYKVLIIDSLTHVWAGSGGILEEKAKKDESGGNSFTNWRPYTDRYNRLIATILSAPIHIILTLRSKQDYEQSDVNGKKSIKKVGMAPVIRDGIDYELTFFFELDASHNATVSKNRSVLFNQRNLVSLDKDLGIELRHWSENGVVDEKLSLIFELKELINFNDLEEDKKKLKDIQINSLTIDQLKLNIKKRKETPKSPEALPPQEPSH